MREVVDIVVRHAVRPMGSRRRVVERQDVAWLAAGPRAPCAAATRAGGRLRGLARSAGGSIRLARPESTRLGAAPRAASPSGCGSRPGWARSSSALRRTMRDLGLVTVCEEAGCPNIFECWADGTATFMINGERCTRACGFCLVDTSHPLPLDADEPDRVADAVERIGPGARGGHGRGARRPRRRWGRRRLPRRSARSGGAARPRRSRCSSPTARATTRSLATIFAARPDVLNHNLETVPRLQRAVRPSAGYARSLAVLARAKTAGLTTKSGMILGMGETTRGSGRGPRRPPGRGRRHRHARPVPATHRRPPSGGAVVGAARNSTTLRAVGEAMGFAHVEASPLDPLELPRRAAAAASERRHRDRIERERHDGVPA